MEEINIWWEGPFTQEEIVGNKINSKKYDIKATSIGLYQVYSSHPLYGADVLVYIGMTEGKGGFQRRLKDTWVIESGDDSENVKIYLGGLFSNSKTIDEKTEIVKIKQAEALLINALTPAFNTQYILSAGRFAKDDFQVNNMNNYRSLYPQLSSQYYWKDEYINFAITDKLANNYGLKVEEDEDEDENSYYGFNMGDNIFFGIDYECWNATNTPLVIGVTKTSETKKNLGKIFEIIYEDKNLFYISASDDLRDENALKEIKEKIKQVEKIVL